MNGFRLETKPGEPEAILVGLSGMGQLFVRR